MRVPKIVDLVKLEACFNRYEDGALWYRILWSEYAPVGDDIIMHTFEFPIQVIGSNDTGGTFSVIEKGITLMRWIRQHLELMSEALADES